MPSSASLENIAASRATAADSPMLARATASKFELSATSRVNVAITANFLGLSTAPLTARLRAGIGWPSPTQAPALLGS